MTQNGIAPKIGISFLLIILITASVFQLKEVSRLPTYINIETDTLSIEKLYIDTIKNYKNIGLISSLFVYPIEFLTQIIEDNVVFQTVKIATWFLGILFIYFVIKKISGSLSFTYLFIAIFILCLQNIVKVDAINSFVVSGHLPLILISLVILCTYNYYENKKKIWIIFSVIFYAFSIFVSELSYSFIFIILITAFLRIRQKKEVLNKHFIELFVFPIVPLLLVFSIFLFTQVSIKVSLEVNSKNNILSEIKEINYPQEITESILKGLPIYNIINWDRPSNITTIRMNYPNKKEFRGHITDFFKIADFKWIIKLLIGVFCIYITIKKVKLNNYSMLMLSFLSLSLIFLPNITYIMFLRGLGLAKDINGNFNEYIFEVKNNYAQVLYYSQIGWSLLIAIIISEFYKNAKKISVFFGKSALLLIVVTFSIFVYLTEFWNHHSYLDENKVTKKWDLVNNFIKSKSINKLQNKSILLAPTLFIPRERLEKNLFSNDTQVNYWSKYFSNYTNKNLEVFNDIKLFKQKVVESNYNIDTYSIVFNESNDNIDSYLIYSNIISFNTKSKNNNIEISSSKSKIYHSSDKKIIYLNIPYQPKEGSILNVSNAICTQESSNVMYAKVATSNNEIPTKIDCVNCLFNPKSIVISYYPHSNQKVCTEKISIPKFDDDFFLEQEGLWHHKKHKKKSRWRWVKGSKKRASILVHNTEKESIKAYLNTKIFSTNTGEVKLFVNGKVYLYQINNHLNDFIDIKNLEITLNPLENFIYIESNFNLREFPNGSTAKYVILDFEIKEK